MIKKFFKALLVIVFLLLMGGYFYVNHIRKAALPDYSANVSLPGLRAPVEVYRDSLGVPHIIARNEHDLYMATGYLEAQDRMWQMDLVRRVTQGRLSEIFGDKAVEADKLLRKLRIPQTSARWWAAMNDSIKNRIQWYADGVNAYLHERGDDLPVEFRILNYKPEPWKPQHSVNLVGYMSWMLELGYKSEALATLINQRLGNEYLKDFLPDWDANKVLVYRSIPKQTKPDTALLQAVAFIRSVAPELSNGSNNWAVAGKKSITGKPIFSNDMHLHLGLPGIWWRAHQIVPGKLNVTGVLLPGSPFVVAGHNEHIAWGMTNVMLDGADFYVETIDTVKMRYKLDGAWKPLKVVKETIRVKGRDEPLIVPMYYTHRGPVMTRLGTVDVQPVSMRWIGNEEDHAIEALYGFDTARNWEEFRRAARGFMAVSQNIAYADIQGNIGLQCTGHVPVRKAPGFMFYPGDTTAYDWQGFVPFEKLPYEFNPERGYISSANNKTFADSLYISEWYDLPYRIIRIRQMLESKEKLSTEDFRRMLNDHKSVRAQRFLPLMRKVLKPGSFGKDELEKAAAALATWDGDYRRDAQAPLLFEETLRQFVRNMAADELGKDLFPEFYASFLMNKYLTDNVFRDTSSVWVDNRNTAAKETFSGLLRQSFSEAIDSLKARYGTRDKTWGTAHIYHLEHPLGKVKLLDKIFGLNADYPAPGAVNTVNPFSFSLTKPYVADFGASEKHIFNTSDWDASYSILPAGESGLPASPHYLDQARAYVDGKVFPDMFSLKRIKTRARYHTRLMPKE